MRRFLYRLFLLFQLPALRVLGLWLRDRLVSLASPLWAGACRGARALGFLGAGVASLALAFFLLAWLGAGATWASSSIFDASPRLAPLVSLSEIPSAEIDSLLSFASDPRFRSYLPSSPSLSQFQSQWQRLHSQMALSRSDYLSETDDFVDLYRSFSRFDSELALHSATSSSPSVQHLIALSGHIRAQIFKASSRVPLSDSEVFWSASPLRIAFSDATSAADVDTRSQLPLLALIGLISFLFLMLFSMIALLALAFIFDGIALLARWAQRSASHLSRPEGLLSQMSRASEADLLAREASQGSKTPSKRL